MKFSGVITNDRSAKVKVTEVKPNLTVSGLWIQYESVKFQGDVGQ